MRLSRCNTNKYGCMLIRILIPLLLMVIQSGCADIPDASILYPTPTTLVIQGVKLAFKEPADKWTIVPKLTIYNDPHRQRLIPVAHYCATKYVQKPVPIAVISHGAGVRYTEYANLASTLAHAGYYVVSIGHHIDTDPADEKTDKVLLAKRGSDAIHHVLGRLRQDRPYLIQQDLILIGHGSGADISMLYTSAYSGRVSNVVCLGTLEQPQLLAKQTRALVLLAADSTTQPADFYRTGVNMQIFFTPYKYTDYSDRTSRSIRTYVSNYILNFLKQRPQA